MPRLEVGVHKTTASIFEAAEGAVRMWGRPGHRDRRVASHYLGKLPCALRSSSKAVSSLSSLEISVNWSRSVAVGFALGEKPHRDSPMSTPRPTHGTGGNSVTLPLHKPTI